MMGDTPKEPRREHDWVEATGNKHRRCQVCEVHAYGPKDAVNPRCPGAVTVNVRLDGDYALAIGQVWPDGDYPDEITPEVVAALMKEHGRWELSNDWDLRPDFLVSVDMSHEVKVDV